MPIPNLFKRRQALMLGGAGTIGLLSGGAITASAISIHSVSSLQSPQSFQVQDAEAYLNPGTFNQQFLAKAADLRQIWDFATFAQVNSDGGFTPIKNAMNAFQFIYKKTLYPIICLRGNAVIYALNDAMWGKYNLGPLYSKTSGNATDYNPTYRRLTTDDGTLGYQDRSSFYQDPSLQALVQRGASIAACHDALNGVSSTLATLHGTTASIVFKELIDHLIPGAVQTPSGSSLIAVAQHLGFTYATQ